MTHDKLTAIGVEPDFTPVDTFMSNPAFGFAVTPDGDDPDDNQEEDDTCTD